MASQSGHGPELVPAVPNPGCLTAPGWQPATNLDRTAPGIAG
jgi:hypothetical protein